jgi:hypothetical protein
MARCGGLLLSVVGSLLLLAGCAASNVVLPSSSPSHRLSSMTCPAARAAIPTQLASTPTVPPGAHLSYSRLALGPLPLQPIYHPGSTVGFSWCAQPDPSQVSTQPIPETLTFGFIGPFATRAAAMADQLPPSPPVNGPPHSFPPPGPIAASASPIHTTTWSGADESARLILPATLAAGYYLFFTQDDISEQACAAAMVTGCRGSGGTSGIVQITPA